MHGYGVSFRVTFEGGLDHRNWVWDFGGMKRAKTKIDGLSPKAWMDHMFDHTIIVAEDDPHKLDFLKMDTSGVAQVRVVPATGAEKFAEYIFHKLNNFVKTETQERVIVKSVEFMEHNKNTAIYSE
jgi:6-pyruvoyltetrahydropterin/6-carboxytetrahydropterin synthase